MSIEYFKWWYLVEYKGFHSLFTLAILIRYAVAWTSIVNCKKVAFRGNVNKSTTEAAAYWCFLLEIFQTLYSNAMCLSIGRFVWKCSFMGSFKKLTSELWIWWIELLLFSTLNHRYNGCSMLYGFMAWPTHISSTLPTGPKTCPNKTSVKYISRNKAFHLFSSKTNKHAYQR